MLLALETGAWLQPLLSGLLGLAGVLVGAWIATQREYNLERSRSDRAAKAAEQTKTLELRTAARLVDQELRDATPLLKETIFYESWPVEGRPQYSTDVFSRYSALFAAALPDVEWADLADGFQHLNDLNWRRIRSERALELDEDGDASTVEHVRPSAVALLRARNVLLQFTTPADATKLQSGSADDLAIDLFPTLDEEYEKFRREQQQKLDAADEGEDVF